MSITIDIAAPHAAMAPATPRVAVTTTIDLIRHGLVCGRPWWIHDDAVARWTGWREPPDGLAQYSAAELIECRRVAVRLNTFLRQDEPGLPIETTPAFHSLEGADRDEAVVRLRAALAGQLAWSVLDVPALQHVAWMEPDLGLAPAPEAGRIDYAGLTASPHRPGWVVLDDTAIDLPRIHEGILDARLRPPARPRARLDLPGIDPDRLDEQRYAPFARAIAAGTEPRRVAVELPSRRREVLELLPLGFTGFIGVSEDVGSAIRAACTGAGPDPGDGAARRAAFAHEVRQIHLLRSRDVKPPTARKVVNRRSRTTSRLRTAPRVEVDGVEHEVSVGPDGIALALPLGLIASGA